MFVGPQFKQFGHAGMKNRGVSKAVACYAGRMMSVAFGVHYIGGFSQFPWHLFMLLDSAEAPCTTSPYRNILNTNCM